MTIPYGRLPCRGEFIRPPSSIRSIASEAPVDWATHWPVAFRRSGGGRRVLTRDQVLAARAHSHGAAPSSVPPVGCALHGASLFLVWPRKSNQKEGHPYIRVLLRKTPLTPALLRGPSRRDIHVPSLLARHPCLASPYATPTLCLLKGTRDRVVWKFWNSDSYKAPSSFNDEQTLRRRRTPLSEGRMESARRGASGMDAARGVRGRGRHRYGWPLYAGPRSADGMREVERSEPGTPSPMQGQDFLVTFLGAGRPAFGKSDSPSRAKPMPRRPPPMGYTPNIQSFVGWKTAKHFPPRSIPQLISDLAHQKRWVSFALPTLRSLEGRTIGSLHGLSNTTKSPLSEGRAQVVWKWLSGTDAARAALGRGRHRHGWPVAAGPWNVTGAREPRRSRGRMQGQAFLLTFFGAGHPASGKSESPSRAKPMPQPTPPIGDTSGSKSQNASRRSTTRTALRLQPSLAPLARRQTPNRHYKRPLVCA